MIRSWTSAHHGFTAEILFKTVETVIAAQGDFEVHFSFELKFSETQVHWLKECFQEELKDAICQNVADILPDMTLGFYQNLKTWLV